MPVTDPKMARNIEAALRIGAIFLVIYLVARIVAPFLPAIVWGIIIAVAAYPAYCWLRERFGGRSTRAAVVFVLIALLLLLVPAVWLGISTVDWGTEVGQKIQDGTLKVPPPPAKVATWPIIGESVHEAWTLASTNLSDALKEVQVQLRSLGRWLLQTIAGVSFGVLQFALSIVVGGALLARSEGATALARKLFRRAIPGSATDFATLSEQTIRSVATGVIGVALIQAALIGVALIAIGVPGAPIWILATIMLGIVQLPATLVTIPIIIWVWGSHTTLTALLFTLWVIPAGLADNVLKPLLLGRGVKAPMLVVFMGAIGGFIASGIIGLFTGAVVLVLAYEVFQAWLNDGDAAEEAPTSSV